MATHTVNLTYFKPGGKYYGEGTFEVPDGTPLFGVFGEVRRLQAAGNLPGIGGRHWHVPVGVPGHPHDHPHLVPVPDPNKTAAAPGDRP